MGDVDKPVIREREKIPLERTSRLSTLNSLKYRSSLQAEREREEGRGEEERGEEERGGGRGEERRGGEGMGVVKTRSASSSSSSS